MYFIKTLNLSIFFNKEILVEQPQKVSKILTKVR